MLPCFWTGVQLGLRFRGLGFRVFVVFFALFGFKVAGLRIRAARCQGYFQVGSYDLGTLLGLGLRDHLKIRVQFLGFTD